MSLGGMIPPPLAATISMIEMESLLRNVRTTLAEGVASIVNTQLHIEN